MIKNHDADKEGYALGLNKFADWSETEISSLFGINEQAVAPDNTDNGE